MSCFVSLVKAFPFLRKPLYNMLYSVVARRQRRAYSDVTAKLKPLKNSHAGEACFIIGTGPSLTVDDLMTISRNGIDTFAPNRIFEICEKHDWRPTYYICSDHDLIGKFRDRIASIKAKLSFLPVDYSGVFKGPEFRFYVLHERDYYPGNARFSRDVSKEIAQGYTVTYAAIQLAAYMGYKNIYLLGVDHNYQLTRDAKGRPVRNSESAANYTAGMSNYVNQQNLPRIEESTIAYETAERISKKLGISIVNATRGGKLEAFRRIDFDTAINIITESK